MNVYRIDALPGVIPLGTESEHGAREIRIDVQPWLDQWPGMSITVWPQLPGGDGHYQARHRMEDGILVWCVSEGDTSAAGYGRVTFLGLADGVRKLSADVRTYIDPTTMTAEAEPPQSQQPWYEAAMGAGVTGQVAWDMIDSKPETFPPADHDHTWAEVTGKPETFPPADHVHNNIVTDETIQALEKRTADLETQTTALKQSGYNVVDNGDLRAPINQRGNTTHSGAGYWLDRWTASTSAFRGEIVSGGINIWSATGAETHLIQYIPITGAMTGKACTLAIKVDGAVYTGTASFTSGKTITFSGGFVYISPKNGNYQVQISTSSTTAILIEWVALYVGTYTADTLPEYQPKGYAAERAECQQYYIPIPEDSGVYGFIAATGASAYVFINVPQMRGASPSVVGTPNIILDHKNMNIVIDGGVQKVTTRGTQAEIALAIPSTNAATPREVISGWVETGFALSYDL